MLPGRVWESSSCGFKSQFRWGLAGACLPSRATLGQEVAEGNTVPHSLGAKKMFSLFRCKGCQWSLAPVGTLRTFADL